MLRRWFQVALGALGVVLCAALTAGAAALPFVLFFAVPGTGPAPDPSAPLTTPWAGDVHQALVTAILATAASAAAIFGLVQAGVFVARRGPFGLLPPALSAVLLFVSGLLLRGAFIGQAYQRAVDVEAAVLAFGMPLTEGLWRGANDVGQIITAIILSFFTIVVDALLAAMYLMFQLAIQSPLLLLSTGAWVAVCFVLSTAPFLLFGPKRA